MKKFHLLILLGSLLSASALFAADAKDDVTAAAKKLAASASYSWSSSSVDGNFKPSTDGKIEKDGFTMLNFSFGGNGSADVVMKEGKGALKFDADWLSFADAEKDDSGGGFNPTKFIAMRMKVFKVPAREAEDLATKTTELKITNGVYQGTLTTEGAKEIMTTGRGGVGTTVTNASGSVKFWITNGLVIKYEFKVAGHVGSGERARDVDRTTTVEIKDVDKTKVEVPEEAKKKLG